MTGTEHYKEAERDIEAANHESIADGFAQYLIARAQVHATLALAAATAYPAMRDYYGDEATDGRDWSGVAS